MLEAKPEQGWPRAPCPDHGLLPPTMECARQMSRVHIGKMFARMRVAATSGISSPHYLDDSLHQPTASWPEVGRRALLETHSKLL